MFPLTVNVLVVYAADPLTTVIDGDKEVAPSKNCTVPAGVPAPGAVVATDAVNVMSAPERSTPLGTTVVVVAALFTCCVTQAELARNVPLPTNCTSTWFAAATGRLDVVNCAEFFSSVCIDTI